MRFAFADQIADLGQLIGVFPNPGDAEPPGQFRDQFKIADLRQRPDPVAVGRAEDGLESTLSRARKRLSPERLPGGHSAQTDAHAVRQFALGEMQPAALQSQIVPRHHDHEGTAATVGSECQCDRRRPWPIRVWWPEQMHESALPCLTHDAIWRIVVATSRITGYVFSIGLAVADGVEGPPAAERGSVCSARRIVGHRWGMLGLGGAEHHPNIVW